MASLTVETVVRSHSINTGKTSERDFSFLSRFWSIPVILITINNSMKEHNKIIVIHRPGLGILLDVLTRLEKVGVVRGIGHHITFAAMSVMSSV